jgi:hypothetical protein
MDFKKLISHIESIDGAIDTPKAPTLADPIRLDEDTEFRVLAGITALTESVIAEKSVSKAQQKAAGAALAAKRGEGKAVGASKEMAKMDTKDLKKFAGTKHKGLPEKKDESIDAEAFRGKFAKMVEAKKGAKPDFLDIDKDGDKKEPMKKAAADKKKGAVGKKDEDVAEGKSPAQKAAQEKFKAMIGKKKGDVKEAEEKRAPAKKQEREVTLPSGAKVKTTKVQGWQSQKADKEANKKDESISKEVKRKAKKVVAESYDSKLTFRDMMRLVAESGGQQQIDPTDQALFVWAQRVAKTKLGEGMKAEVYAGMVYERMGGRFEMYDVLSEDQK